MRRLIIRPGAIGDCILALPAMECLKAAYTEVWVPSPIVPLIQFAHRVRAIPSTGVDLIGIPGRDAPMHFLEDFGQIDSWYGTNRDEFRAAVTHLPFRFHPALPPPGSRLHAADFFAAQVGAPTPALPQIDVAPRKTNEILIHPFSGGRRKNWPLHRFQALAQLLPGPVRFCAGPEEPLPGALRIDNLYELAAHLAGSRLYIGNDSGITHLAAAAGAKTLAIFGPTHPAVWAPRGPNVSIVHGPLESLTVESVLRAVASLF